MAAQAKYKININEYRELVSILKVNNKVWLNIYNIKIKRFLKKLD